jgi:hypothetical protein
VTSRGRLLDSPQTRRQFITYCNISMHTSRFEYYVVNYLKGTVIMRKERDFLVFNLAPYEINSDLEK